LFVFVICDYDPFILFSAKATYAAISKTYSFLTPDLWKETVFQKSPYQEFTDFLAKNHKPIGAQRQEQKHY
jgi:small subunit ribosomal protein S2e